MITPFYYGDNMTLIEQLKLQEKFNKGEFKKEVKPVKQPKKTTPKKEDKQ